MVPTNVPTSAKGMPMMISIHSHAVGAAPLWRTVRAILAHVVTDSTFPDL